MQRRPNCHKSYKSKRQIEGFRFYLAVYSSRKVFFSGGSVLRNLFTNDTYEEVNANEEYSWCHHSKLSEPRCFQSLNLWSILQSNLVDNKKQTIAGILEKLSLLSYWRSVVLKWRQNLEGMILRENRSPKCFGSNYEAITKMRRTGKKWQRSSRKSKYRE